MKQLLFLIVLTAIASAASLASPFWALLLYYTFSVLRPQYMWRWALPVEIRWSLIAALVVTVSTFMNLDQVLNRSRFNAIAGLMFVYGLLMGISVLGAYDTETAQKWGLEYAKIILMAIATSVLVTRLWQVKILSMMVLLMVGYIAWQLNSLYVFEGRLDIFHHGYGDLDNNGAGLLLGMGTGFAYSFGVSAPRLWQRGLSWFLGVLMIHAILMSYSRGAMLATLVGITWLVLNHRPRIQAVIIAVVLFMVISVLAGQEIRTRFFSTSEYQKDYSAQSRFASWAAAWDLAWERPLIGQGVRNSNQFTYYYGADRRGRTIHNQFLQVAADSGFPAAGVLAVMLATGLVFLQRGRWMCSDYLWDCDHGRVPAPPDDQRELIDQTERIALGCQASLITFIIAGIFLSLEGIELPWLVMAIAGVLPVTLACHLQGLVQPEKVTSDRQPKPRSHIRPIPRVPGGVIPTPTA